MVAEAKFPDAVDPLDGCSIISLLPRTHRSFDQTAVSEQGDIEFLQSYLKTVRIECPDKHLKQAKAILSSTSEPQNSEFPCPMLSDVKETDILGKDKNGPQEQRPALGRKRAQFSFKPNASQPALDENVNLNIDQLQDPEDFFSAFESLENAKKELQRQRGNVSADITTHHTSMKARNCRPGLLGRKTVSYKHRHSSVLVDSDEVTLSSEKIFEVNIPSQSNNSLIIEMADQHAESKEKALAYHEHIDGIQRKGLLSEEGKKVSSLLDEILNTNCTEIDEDGAVTFLQDRLQIKPFNLEKLCLPKLDSVRRSDIKTSSVEQLGWPRKALSDIHNTLRRVGSKTINECQQVVESSMFPLASPNPPRSSYSAMTDLKRRLSQMEPPINPFSFRGIDASPARNCSQVEDTEKHDVSPNNDYDPNDTNDATPAEDSGKKMNFTGHFQSMLLKEGNPMSSNMVSKKLLRENSACPHDMPTDEVSNIKKADMNIRSSGSGSDQQVIPPHSSNVHNDACNSDTPSLKFNEKRLSFSQRLQSPVLQEDNIADSNMVTGKLLTEILASPDINMEGSLNRVNSEMDITLSGSDGDKHKVSPIADYDHNVQSPMLEEHNTTGSSMLSKKLVTETSASQPGMPTDENSNRVNSDINIRSSGPDDKGEDTHEEAVTSEEPELDFEGLPKENMDYRSHPDQLDIVAGDHLPKDGYSESRDIFPEKNNEQSRQEPSGISMNERSNPKTPPHIGMKRKEISHQKSLSGKLFTENLSSPPEMCMNENPSRLNTDMDTRSNGSDDVEDQTQPESSGVSKNERNKQEGPSQDRRKQNQACNRKSLTGKVAMENTSCLPEMSMDENPKRHITDMDIRSSGSDVVQDQMHQESCRASTNGSRKQEGPPHNRRKRKEISNRKSLAGAGTVFDGESGRRKSTRYKTPPLEFWKGECFVYGRPHNTMSTVIGVKRHESPASAKAKGRKKLKPTRFKLESLVSDEFKDVLEKAALH